MEKKHIITLSGKPGSGKSSTADKVAELLNYTRHSSGDMVRRILKKNHMTLEEYNARAETDHSLDAEVDEQLRSLRDQEDIVVDSRLGFYWIPESFKVYLDLDLDLATARIFKDTVSNDLRRASEANSTSLNEVSKQVRERMLNEQSRFKQMYGVDPYNKNYFDFIIDTSRQNPQSVAIAVFDAYKEWLDSEVWEQQYHTVPLGYSLKNKY
ncbi:cytidylate kinase family protein [Candidatus Kaiserbacteria bacterium]|nr:cytidylate kinase family protein [Candidatus Kaiserbacteria bacterium]USN92403.1 MAG: cytidylate kinase family protein [Candidatus Nomurabacteria bacterium]